MPTTSAAYPHTYFERKDNSADHIFYAYPRMVTHIDEAAIATLSDLFAELLVPDETYLDLMSSWRTHLPDSIKPARVAGLGMNAEEMADNPQLDDFLIHDLNHDPVLPYESNLFDAVFCTVSVQYLTHPLEVFTEVLRVLRPGGVFIVSFSNRCFANKAVTVWVQSQDNDHITLVNSYFQLSGKWQNVHARIKDTAGSDPLYMLWGYKSATD